MATYALINKTTNIVDNVVEWDGKGNMFSDYLPVEIGDGTFVMAGSKYENGAFTGPILETPDMTP